MSHVAILAKTPNHRTESFHFKPTFQSSTSQQTCSGYLEDLKLVKGEGGGERFGPSASEAAKVQEVPDNLKASQARLS